jgi:lipopolysaccharide transport system permease protein
MNPIVEREIILIEADRAEANYWRDLWRYRELFVILAWRDLSVRYRQTAAGMLWALIQPLVTMAVFVVFGRLAGTPTQGAPRALLVLAAVLPWQFFAAALGASSGSLIANSHLISKVYFPRLLIPISALAVSFVDFLVSAALLMVFMLIYGQLPDWRCVAMPFFALIAAGAAFGGGLWFTALTVKYRDFRYIVPFALQVGVFLSPVAFSSTLVPVAWRWLYMLNPMAVAIEGFRWSLLNGRGEVALTPIVTACVVVVALVATGLAYFRRVEQTFADVI